MTVYAFIDSQNLNLGTRKDGWLLDFRKFRTYLRDKYKVQKAFLFIGYISKYEKLYRNLRIYGYILIFKPVLVSNPNNNKIVKGNVDAELVLRTMIEFSNYSNAIIVTGDGDFLCLVDYLDKNSKLLKVLFPSKRYSSLYKNISYKKCALLYDIRHKLSKKI